MTDLDRTDSCDVWQIARERAARDAEHFEPDQLPGEPPPGTGIALAVLICAAFWAVLAAIFYVVRYV